MGLSSNININIYTLYDIFCTSIKYSNEIDLIYNIRNIQNQNGNQNRNQTINKNPKSR